MNYFHLLEKFATGSATETEKDGFNQWLETLSEEECRQVLDAYAAMLSAKETDVPYNGVELEKLLEKIKDTTAPVKHLSFGRRTIAWAAAILLLLAAGGFFLFSRSGKTSPEKTVSVQPEKQNDVLPGKEGAILTLADGSKMILDSMGNGVVTTQAGVAVTLQNGQLIYAQDSLHHAGEVLYNTMTTPKGRQYQLVLPDGSKVWLNAASSITYPVVFTAGERQVKITGEAYFEVAHVAADKRNIPFVVTIDERATVEVLGTHFNINAYADENFIHATLLQGSVKVNTDWAVANAQPVILKPGQQAQMTTGKAIKVVSDADIEEVMAWKNGLFHFEDANIKTVMRQLARWYNLDVVYEGGLPKGSFTGELERNLTLTQLLKILSGTRVKYRIEEGNRIVILG